MPPQEAIESVHIYDHPESRITFLETTLADKQWRATIYPSALEKGQNFDVVRHALQKHGYHVEDGQDKYGNATLNILHLPADSSLRDNIRALGLAQGAEHTLSHMSAERLFGKVKHGVNYVIGDKAHLYSAFYIVGDLLLMFCGADNENNHGKLSFGEKLKTLRAPENAMQSIGGACSLLNSIIAMVYAQEGNSREYKHMKEQFYKAMIHGKDPTDPTGWEPPKEDGGLISKTDRWLEHNPIAGAATAQIISQVLNMGSGGIRWNKYAPELNALRAARAEGIEMCEREVALNKTVKGSKMDVARGIPSILGWMGMLYPAHKVEKKDPWYHPMRAVQEFQEHPERFTSILTGGASAIGVVGGRDKGNFSQAAGEISVILGDVTIFFTEISEYGGAVTPEKLAKNAAKFISESPALLDDEQRASFVQRVSHYLSGHMAARDPTWKPDEAAPKLAEGITAELEKLPNRLNDAADELAALISNMPEHQRKAATSALCETLASMPGVYTGKERLEQEVGRRLEPFATTAGQPQNIRDTAHHLAALVGHVPTLAVPQNTMRLYDVMTQFAASSPRDMLYLSHAMKHQITQHTGIGTTQLAQVEKQAQSQHRTVH